MSLMTSTARGDASIKSCCDETNISISPTSKNGMLDRIDRTNDSLVQQYSTLTPLHSLRKQPAVCQINMVVYSNI